MDLGRILDKLPATNDKNLLVDTSTADDAGVYKLTDEIALIQTVDFFTPVVDDPYMYGQIAAANSFSDVYAMGGSPLTALNIMAFPPDIFPAEVMAEILRGGADKAIEAGAVIAGGHTITDDELKYGLAVTGIGHPLKIVTNAAARPGDKLVLTKPIGTGIISTAIKAGKEMGDLANDAARVMAELNREAALAMQETGAHACTDITGFGLLGHTWEVAAGSALGINIFAAKVPFFNGVMDLIKERFVPGGTRSNALFLHDKVVFPAQFPKDEQILLCDAQTSGGLLISVAADKLDMLIESLEKYQVQTKAVIGEVVAEHPGKVHVL